MKTTAQTQSRRYLTTSLFVAALSTSLVLQSGCKPWSFSGSGTSSADGGTAKIVKLPDAANFAGDICDLVNKTLKAAPKDAKLEIQLQPMANNGFYECHVPMVLDRSHSAIVGNGIVRIRLATRARVPLVILGSILRPTIEGILPVRTEDVRIANMELDGNKVNQMDPGLEQASITAKWEGQAKYECWNTNGKGKIGCDECWAPNGGGYIYCGEQKSLDKPYPNWQQIVRISDDTSFIRNNGVTIRGVSYGVVENVKTYSNLSGGLVTEKECDHLTVNNFTSFDNVFDGFAGYRTVASTFSNLKLCGNRFSGISIDLQFSNNLFKDSEIFQNHDNGIFARASEGNKFENVTVRQNENFAVYLNFDISSYRFKDMTIWHNWGPAFRAEVPDAVPNSKETPDCKDVLTSGTMTIVGNSGDKVLSGTCSTLVHLEKDRIATMDQNIINSAPACERRAEIDRK